MTKLSVHSAILGAAAFTLFACTQEPTSPEASAQGESAPDVSRDEASFEISHGAPVFELSEDDLAERAFYQQPNSYFAERLDEAPVTIDGQVLHPKLQYEIQERRKEREKRTDQKGKDYNGWLMSVFSTPEGKSYMRGLVEKNWTKQAFFDAPMRRVEDFEVEGPSGPIRVRVYWPDTAPAEDAPALLYFHGGAYTIASIEAVEPQARILANRAQVVVASVDYHLAPEHVFPAAQEDAIAAYEWFAAQADELKIDPHKIAVGGDSAGANLTAVVTQEVIRRGLDTPPAANLFYYPFLDADVRHFPSYELFGDGFGLDKAFMDMVTDMFAPDPEMLKHPWLQIVDSQGLETMPPTIIATSGFDPIRDHGIIYGEKLERAGVEVVRRHYPSLTHGFLESSGTIDDAQRASFETAADLKKILYKK